MVFVRYAVRAGQFGGVKMRLGGRVMRSGGREMRFGAATDG